MFLCQLLSNVENTPNFLEFCVLVDFRIRQEIPAFIDEAKNNLNVNTLVLYESIGKVALIADNPSTFPNFERSYPCIDGLCIPCVWILVSMQQVSLCLVDFRHSSLEFDPFATVPGGLENLLLSTHLRIFDFRFRITLLPVSWCLADSFSFIVIHRIDSRSRTWWRSFLLALAVHHQIQRCCFCCRWATVRGCFPSSFRHGTNHNVLSNLWERTLENGCKNTSRNTLHWTNTAGDSIHFSRNFLWSECPRFGFCFQQIWFGFLVPNWFCQTTNQERLCEFSTHVSPYDFVLWLTFWSQLRCLQRCTTEIHLEKNVCWWVHDPHHSIDQPHVVFWLSGSWLWNDGLYVSVEPCC